MAAGFYRNRRAAVQIVESQRCIRVALMAGKLMSVLGVGLLAFALTGCASDQTFRGQCPPGSTVNCKNQRCGGRGLCGDTRCGGGGATNRLNLPFHPVHRNYVDYQAPSNLSYPQQNTPAATVQYPYYTTKGPTDFFMK